MKKNKFLLILFITILLLMFSGKMIAQPYLDIISLKYSIYCVELFWIEKQVTQYHNSFAGHCFSIVLTRLQQKG